VLNISPRIAAYGFLISERETIPPQAHVAPRPAVSPSRRLTPAGGLPLRPERHVPTSIATLRCRLIKGHRQAPAAMPRIDRIREWVRKIVTQKD
jgi:hypothetical protein